MAPKNGNKVGVREFYAELMQQNKNREEMERRLVEAINDAATRIDQKYDKRLGCAETDIVALRIADRKWGGLTALAAAAFTGIGTAFGVWIRK